MTTQTRDNGSQNTVISADSIQAENLAMGDFHQHLYSDKPQLVRVYFGDSDQEYLPPNYFETLFRQTADKRIVFISGDNVLSKTDLARHLSSKIIQQNPFKEFKIVELLQENEHSDARTSIFDILNKEHCEQKVVLLTDLHPEKIDYNFDKLLDYAVDHSCVFIISVNHSLETWKKAGTLVGDFWFNIPDGRHYSEEQLLDFFLLQLEKNPPVFMDDNSSTSSTNTLLSATLTVQSVIDRFNSLDQVNLFLKYYVGLPEFPSDRKVIELIEALCNGHAQMVRSWFYQLTHRNKIIALSAALFDGLLIDQYFEALNNITAETFWETSDPSLKALDYFHLSFLDTFFLIQTRGEQQYILSKTPLIKSILLELGKTEYRRHFKTAFQAFYTFMNNTYSRKSINWELYGTPSKRVLIRRSYTETLRDTGSLEFNLVENQLLELAASGNAYLQSICAKAMAQWRLSGNEELFFKTLKSWQEDTDIEERIKELFDRNTRDTTTDNVNAIDLIKTTAVLALGHASYYDQPNKLHEKIIEGMVHFAQETYSHVSKSIHQALPQFIHHHSQQLQHTIFETLMPKDSLREPIVKGLLLAIQDYPEQVSGALQRWFDGCMEDASRLNRRQQPTQRDNRLIIILNVLEQADLSKNELFINEKVYTHFLIPLLQQEKRNEVLSHVLNLLAKIHSYNFELAARFSAKTIGVLTKNQRLFLVVQWGKIYSQQRLETADKTYERDDTTYALWTDQQARPLTSIETVLYQWMESDSTMRRFATLVFLEIAQSYDRFESRALDQHQQAIQQQLIWEMQQVQTAPAAKPAPPAEINLHLFLRIRIFFYFLFASNENKYLLKDTLLLFLNVNRYTSADLERLIQRWQRSEQKGITSKLAKWLYKFL